MKKILKNSLSFIVSLTTMFLILIASFSLFLDRVILNEKTYMKVLEKDKIYEQVESYIYENIEYLLMESNIPEDILNDVISKEEIEEVLCDYVYYTVGFMKSGSGEIEPLNKTIYEERINDKINAYLRENKMYVSTEFNENLDEFKSNILNIISSSLQIIDLNALSNSNGIKAIAKLSSLISGVKFFAMIVLAIVLLSLLQFIIWSKKRRARRYAWIGYSFVSAGMIIFLIGLSGYLSGFYKHIAIGVEHLRNAIVAIMQGYLLNFTYIGLASIALGLLFMFVYWKHLFKVYSNSSRVSNKAV